MTAQVVQNYYDINVLSRSSLCDLKVSPYYFWSKHIAKETTYDTNCMKIGRAFHCAVLEPKKFNDFFMVMPKINRRTKIGKGVYQEFIGQSFGKDILTNEQNELIDKLTFRLENYAPAKKLIQSCEEREKEFYYIYKGFDFKSKLDALSVGHGIVIDVKTIADSKNNKQTSHDAIKFNYAEQVFLYSYAFEQAYKKRPKFIFINVSKKAPFEVSIYDASGFYDYGKMSINNLLKKYEECISKWGNDPIIPWHDDSINELQLPAWAEDELCEYKNGGQL